MASPAFILHRLRSRLHTSCLCWMAPGAGPGYGLPYPPVTSLPHIPALHYLPLISSTLPTSATRRKATTRAIPPAPGHRPPPRAHDPASTPLCCIYPSQTFVFRSLRRLARPACPTLQFGPPPALLAAVALAVHTYDVPLLLWQRCTPRPCRTQKIGFWRPSPRNARQMPLLTFSITVDGHLPIPVPVGRRKRPRVCSPASDFPHTTRLPACAWRCSSPSHAASPPHTLPCGFSTTLTFALSRQHHASARNPAGPPMGLPSCVPPSGTHGPRNSPFPPRAR